MKIDLSTLPRVVATVTQADDLAYLQQNADFACDVLEFRLDNLAGSARETLSLIESSKPMSLTTVRRSNEGGAGSLSDEERISLYRAAMPHTDWIDTEVSSLQSPAFAGFVADCKAADVGVVGSFHDFEQFPGVNLLQDKVEIAYESGAHVAKLAVVIETMADLFALTQLVEKQRESGRLISAMGMGSLGKLSRLVLGRAGSCLNYGYLQTPNAPGQWSARELSDLLSKVAG